jgi:hypothetical protein
MTTEPTQRGSEGEFAKNLQTAMKWFKEPLPMEPELWAAGADLDTAHFVARVLAEKGYMLVSRPASPVGVSEEQVTAALKVWSDYAWATIRERSAYGTFPKDGPREAMRAALQAVIAAVPTPDGATP